MLVCMASAPGTDISFLFSIGYTQGEMLWGFSIMSDAAYLLNPH